MFETLQLNKEIFPEKFILRLINYNIFPTKCCFEIVLRFYLTDFILFLHDFESKHVFLKKIMSILDEK